MIAYNPGKQKRQCLRKPAFYWFYLIPLTLLYLSFPVFCEPEENASRGSALYQFSENEEIYRNPASIGKYPGFTLGFYSYTLGLSTHRWDHFIVPLPGNFHVAYFTKTENAYNSYKIDRNVGFSKRLPSSLSIIGDITLGLNYRAYENSEDALNPGIIIKPFHVKGMRRLTFGIYSNHIANMEEQISTTMIFQSSWLSKSGLLGIYGEFGVYGAEDGSSRLFNALFHCEYIGVSLTPYPLINLTWLTYQNEIGELRLTYRWDRDSWLSHTEVKLALRREKDRFGLRIGLQAGLFGRHIYKKRYKPSYTKYKAKALAKGTAPQLDAETWNRQFDQYQKNKIGVFRGRVWPAFNTFGYLSTFFLPAGGSCLAVGRYKTGLIILWGHAAVLAPVLLSTTSKAEDVTHPIYFLGTMALKLTDFVFSQIHVHRVNKSLKAKYQLTAYPFKDGVAVTAVARF